MSSAYLAMIPANFRTFSASWLQMTAAASCSYQYVSRSSSTFLPEELRPVFCCCFLGDQVEHDVSTPEPPVTDPDPMTESVISLVSFVSVVGISWAPPKSD